MNIYTAANWFTCLADSYFMFMMCETFLKRREEIDTCFYLISIAVTA